MLKEDTFRHQGMRRKLVDQLRRKGISDERVLAALGKIPRHQFIDDSAFERFAYADQAFPIGQGQTISQPYTVAVQTELLKVQPGDKVLEIGTGSGYQTAVLCELGAKVHSIERQRALYRDAKKRLADMGYKARVIHGDGYQGLPQDAPFDKIIVTCGAPEVPEALLQQLAMHGRLVVPVGGDQGQVMWGLERTEHGMKRTEHGLFSFVPMVGDRTKD